MSLKKVIPVSFTSQRIFQSSDPGTMRLQESHEEHVEHVDHVHPHVAILSPGMQKTWSLASV